jgi:hypothetical protein
LGASPSKKAVACIKEKVGNLLVPGNTGAWEEVRDKTGTCRIKSDANFASCGIELAKMREFPARMREGHLLDC